MGGGDASSAAANNSGDEKNNSNEDVVISGSGAGSDGVTVNVRCSNGSKFSVQVSLESTVGSFKSVLAQNCEIPAELQRLIYKGRILKDDQTLQSYGLEADHTVHLVRGFAAAAAAAANASAAGNNGATNANPNANPSAPRDAASAAGEPFGGSGLGASLFPGLGLNGLGSGGAGGGLFGAGLPEFEQVQQQLTQNPNMMRDILNMPLVQNLMNNPDIIRNLIMNNPQMREIMDRNPELAHILNDPATLRQTMEAARNPELMREMMRNTDRAMSNIESSPEGFNMLRRMYENVQESFLNATAMGGDNRNNLASNPFAALLGTQGGAPSGDQSTNPTTTAPDSTTNAPAPNTNPLPNPWASGGGGGAQTNSAPRSNPAADDRAPPLGDLNGVGFPDFERMLGSMPDPSSLSQMMQNPAVSQMMQSLLSNPQYMNQVLGLNPQLRGMLDSNSQLREMLQNPDFIRQLTSPETMQQLMTFQQSLLSQLGRQQNTQESGRNAGGGGATGTLDNTGLEMLMSMFGGLGTGGLTVPNRSNVPPEELYATQLSQLQEMGFFDTQENIRALVATAGNVHAAVERLLGNSGQ
ncbi:ubiquitin domain-containing protein DSK2a isoform X1 [Coffea arabica]|uniref:Ubiquitin domain-containing protein DSK2a isoform X1 n=1 Tax=Coffea arabica TaxID=13443 RepID=A0ABM4V5A0_COFAR